MVVAFCQVKPTVVIPALSQWQRVALGIAFIGGVDEAAQYLETCGERRTARTSL